jgi:hypothetical protein
MPEQIGARTQAMLASSPIGAPAGSNSGVPVMEAEVTDDLASQPAAVLRHAGSAPLGLGWLGRQQGATAVQSSSLATGLLLTQVCRVLHQAERVSRLGSTHRRATRGNPLQALQTPNGGPTSDTSRLRLRNRVTAEVDSQRGAPGARLAVERPNRCGLGAPRAKGDANVTPSLEPKGRICTAVPAVNGQTGA